MQRPVRALTLSLIASFLATAVAAPAEPLSLMQIVSEWRYPDAQIGGAQMSDGETVAANGERTKPSIFCMALMTTDAPIEKVLDFYRGKLNPAAKGEANTSEGRSVVFSDDSDGRPFAMHTVFVNTGDTSTTLVITRGKGESKTHIAWKQYRQFKP